MKLLFLKDIIIYITLAVVLWMIAKEYNLIGTGKAKDLAKKEAQVQKKLMKKRERKIAWLRLMMWFYDNVGVVPSESALIEYDYRITRFNREIKVLKRTIKPEELLGFFKFVNTLGVSVSLLTYFLGLGKLSLVFLLSLSVKPIYNMIIDSKIKEEDDEIELDFPDLYLLLYSRLKKGAYTRLAPTLNDYIKSLEKTSGEKSHQAIRKFALDLANNLDIYGSDAIALRKIREKYRSAMIINFCNLAIQALANTDNSDKLLSFKVELALKRSEEREAKANKLVAKGQRAIMVVYLILAQFVILSWVAKIGGANLMP